MAEHSGTEVEAFLAEDLPIGIENIRMSLFWMKKAPDGPDRDDQIAQLDSDLARLEDRANSVFELMRSHPGTMAMGAATLGDAGPVDRAPEHEMTPAPETAIEPAASDASPAFVLGPEHLAPQDHASDPPETEPVVSKDDLGESIDQLLNVATAARNRAAGKATEIDHAALATIMARPDAGTS